MIDSPDDTDRPAATGAPSPSAAQPVQYCPYCGESVGSFWGRRGDDGSHWCESCQGFFRVEHC